MVKFRDKQATKSPNVQWNFKILDNFDIDKVRQIRIRRHILENRRFGAILGGFCKKGHFLLYKIKRFAQNVINSFYSTSFEILLHKATPGKNFFELSQK